jgi:hypothetical protein
LIRSLARLPNLGIAQLQTNAAKEKREILHQKGQMTAHVFGGKMSCPLLAVAFIGRVLSLRLVWSAG